MQEPLTRVSVLPENFHASGLDMRCVYGDIMALRTMYPSATSNEILFGSMLQKHITVHPLPRRVRELQLRSLWRIYSSCFKAMQEKEVFCFCVLCALNGRLGKTKMRLSSVDDELGCTVCPPGTVVRVRMTGVLLKICNNNFYMCPSCTDVCAWHADGFDLCPVIHQSGEDCVLPQSCVPSIDGVGCACHCNSGLTTAPDKCIVCASRTVVRSGGMVIPDLLGKRMVHVSFCGKHALPAYLAKNVHNLEDLATALQQHAACGKSGGSAKTHKGATLTRHRK